MSNEELKAQNIEHVLEVSYELFLENGIENVTKEMISKQSGFSRKTLDRYFNSKTDCVIRTAEWVMQNIRMNIGSNYQESMFTSGQYTGLQLMEKYMYDIKALFFDEPRYFILYKEFKLYIRRNCEDYEQKYTLLLNWMGNRQVREKIRALGKKDGTIKSENDMEEEEEFFSESYFGFLASLAIYSYTYSREELEKHIDKRIENTIEIYRENN
jgi:AcrR family transcriptional regulator